MSPTIATCPSCGNKDTIFIRSADDADLVCRSTICRGSAASQSTTQATLPRRILRRRR